MLRNPSTALLSFGLLAFVLPACQKTIPETPYSAGETHLSFTSPSTANTLDAQVWYPAPKDVGERQVFYTTAYWGQAAPDAAVESNERFPLVLIAHGWRGTRFDMSWLAEDLARHGFIVASFDSPGCDAKTYVDFQAPKMWYRAELMQQLTDAIAKDSRFASVVDTTRVAAIGHSAGGSTSLVLGGAKPDPQNFAKEFPESAPVIDGPWHDARVRAVVAMAPGTGPAFAPSSFAELTVPTLILSGSADRASPEASNAKFYADHIRGAQWRSIANASHYTFTQECSVYAQLRHFPTCNEVPGATPRADVHAEVLGWVRTFLSQSLGGPIPPLHAGN